MLYCKKIAREVNAIMKGQRKSGVTSVAALMAGVKPDKNEMPTKGAKVSTFEKDQLYTDVYYVNLTELGEGLKWKGFVGVSQGFVYVVDACAGKTDDYNGARKNNGASCRSLQQLIVFLKYKPRLM